MVFLPTLRVRDVNPTEAKTTIEHLLVALHPVTVARNQPAATGVGRRAKSVELQLE
jgi:hypothetical protein